MMKKSFFVALIALSAFSRCGSTCCSAPKSVEGKWAYTTPDGKVAITFDLVKSTGGSLDIQNPTIKVNGTSYIAAGQIDGVALPAIGSIMVNANDPKSTYSYLVSFSNTTVSSDFTKITVASGTWEFPATQTNDFTNVTITRP